LAPSSTPGGSHPGSWGPEDDPPECPMMTRTIATAFFLGFLVTPGPTLAADPPRRAENVIVVTLDGFRPQEFFAGADETLIDAKAGGVPDPVGLRRRYWRDTAEERREALLPFLWKTVATKGQVFGDRSRNAPAVLTNGMKFSYPGYSEMFC